MDLSAASEIGSVDELTDIIGEPPQRVLDKERPRLHELDRQWLAASPFCLVATSDSEGRCDVSPKGDPAGFTRVLDERTIAVPERPGNRQVDGFRNILRNPHVGLLYFIPGRGDTLRINGRARLLRDAPFFDDLVVKGHRPEVVLLVEIEQVFHHCAKAFLRSGLWNPETWDPDAVTTRARIAKELERPDDSLTELEHYYSPDQYRRTLYDAGA
ncbi:pyridoxamine 5'-phosphate oxidase family protein [Saccharopolyspora halophila]